MKKHRHFNRMFALTAGLAVSAFPFGAAQAVDTQIRTDNTLSGITALNVNAPGSATTYQITEANGKTAGNNLFYSFSNFNVGATDTAWFNLNSANLSNVVSRVTGGFESVIDGGLKMTNAGSSPAFFFINPAGITFGAGASVDVPGSFYASTASSLQFADGYKYNADGSNTNTLSSASPESFGFLGDESGAINIDGATLKFKPGTDAAFVGNSITIDSATIASTEKLETGMTASGIDLQLVATGATPADIKLDTLPEQATGGDISIQNSDIEVSGNGSGRIAIRAGNVVAVNSTLFVDNWGDVSMTKEEGIDVHTRSFAADNTYLTSDVVGAGNGGSVNVTVDQTLTLNNSTYIKADTFGNGNAGTVTIDAEQIEMTDSFIKSETYSNGNAGTVTVNAGQIKMDNSGMWSSGVIGYEGYGEAGQVTVTADILRLARSSILSEAWNHGNAGTVTVNAGQMVISDSAISSMAALTGNAGQVTLTADTLKLFNSYISSETWIGSEGNTGRVTVNAGQLEIDASRILSSTSGTGDAGTVQITTDTLKIADGGEISSSTSGLGIGNGGAVTVEAGQIDIDGQGYQGFTGITSSADIFSSGDAGTVQVTADTLHIANGGQISTSTSGSGNAGAVTVNAEEVEIDGQGYQGFTGITSSADIFSSGDAGTVQVTADTLHIANGGQISTSTSGSGNAGAVTVNAEEVEIDGQGYQGFTGITSSADIFSRGNAGSVAVTVDGELSIANGGSIDTSTFGTGSAGVIIVKADTLSIQGSGSIPLENLGRYYEVDGINPAGIFSVASANSSGQPGTINITAGHEINLTNGAQISISNEATVADPSFLKPTAITLAAPNITLTGSQIVADSSGNVDAGDITINFEDTLSLDPSAISTVANQGNGGDISINGGNLIALQDSEITTSVLGASGNGGDINISADYLIMNTGFIQANTAAEGATGGLVNIDVDALIPSGGLLYLGGDEPYQFQPYSGINVIQAAAPSGVSGTINVANPQLNLSGTLANLVIPAIDTQALSRNMCTVGNDSSLLLNGNGGLRRRSKDALVSTMF